MRTPQGELEPLLQVDADTLERLAVQARLLGLDLSAWLVTILRGGILREPGPEQTVEEYMGQWVEFTIPPDVVQGLKRQLWDPVDHGSTLGEVISAWLGWVSTPGHVLQLRRLSAAIGPIGAALVLMGESSARNRLPWKEEHRLEKQDRREYEAEDWQTPLKNAGFLETLNTAGLPAAG